MYRLILLAVLCVAALPLQAASNGRIQMQRFLQDLSTWQVDFEQSMLSADQGKALLYRGKLLVMRPGRFRWEYSEPEERLIVADGNNIWLQEEDLEQVSVVSQSLVLEGTPAQFLIDDQPLDQSFDVVEIGASRGLEWVELLPKKQEAEFRRIIVGFSDNQLVRMEMFDQYGQVTRVAFSNGSKNLAIDPDLFQYEPPDGFDVFNRE